jgi:hypothetical protein
MATRKQIFVSLLIILAIPSFAEGKTTQPPSRSDSASIISEMYRRTNCSDCDSPPASTLMQWIVREVMSLGSAESIENNLPPGTTLKDVSKG